MREYNHALIHLSCCVSYLYVCCCSALQCCTVSVGVQALEGARQKNDNIKDEIWHELAQVQYLCWQRDSAAALERQQLLQNRMQHLLQQQHSQELAKQVGYSSLSSKYW